MIQHQVPSLNSSGFFLAINYNHIDGTPDVIKMDHPQIVNLSVFSFATVAYEVKTYNADKNTPAGLFKAFTDGIKQVKHRANLPGVSAAVLVFDDKAWLKLRNSSYGSQVTAIMQEVSTIQNLYGEQKIFLKIETGLARDAQKVYYALSDRIKNL